MKFYIDFLANYENLTLTPYVNIDWTDDTKDRGAKICVAIGWLFWGVYIDII